MDKLYLILIKALDTTYLHCATLDRKKALKDYHDLQEEVFINKQNIGDVTLQYIPLNKKFKPEFYPKYAHIETNYEIGCKNTISSYKKDSSGFAHALVSAVQGTKLFSDLIDLANETFKNQDEQEGKE